MNWNSIKVISSYVVREFVAGGGSLRYVAEQDDDGRYWEVIGVDRDGNELPVIIGRTGLPKVLRSADAILTYHKRMQPSAREVTIQLHEVGSDTDDSDDNN